MATNKSKPKTKSKTTKKSSYAKQKPTSKPRPKRVKSKSHSLKIPFLALFSLLIATAIVCAFFFLRPQNIPKIENYPITHETKFGGVYIRITIDDFNNLGFKYGDSVDVKFSNGYELLDLPYYNGYYVDLGEPLLISYPGYDYVKAGINYGDDLWLTANLTEDDTASIVLNKHEKYIDIQNARDIHYSDVQGDTPDITFANFRNVEMGNLRSNTLYRSASPSDNSHNRAPIVDRLIADAHINFIINLSDSAEDLVSHINKSDFNSPYFLSLYQAGKVIPLSMSASFKEQAFKDSLVKGLTAMSENPGPYLIHCVEGKDRTGYVIMLLEALLGASYEEIVDDYMITYDNYYGINQESDPARYKTIKEKNLDIMLYYIIGDEKNKQNLSKISDYSTYAKTYLLSIGMPESTITQLIQNLAK